MRKVFIYIFSNKKHAKNGEKESQLRDNGIYLGTSRNWWHLVVVHVDWRTCTWSKGIYFVNPLVIHLILEKYNDRERTWEDVAGNFFVRFRVGRKFISFVQIIENYTGECSKSSTERVTSGGLRIHSKSVLIN